jgi:anaerobic magnesium-protoporphyrin IX monomethyl ester cyclase
MDFFIIYLSARSNRTSDDYIPMGGLFLSEALLNEGYDVKILDDTLDNVVDSLRRMSSHKTIAFGISTLSGTQLKNSIMLAKILRKEFPHIPIIWGGAHVTALPKQTLESEWADYVVWGEGELSIIHLLNAIRNGTDVSSIKGIGYKKSGQCFLTENAGYTPLNRLFQLPYHLIDMKKYARKLNIGVERCYYIHTSRGCPFRCRFCSNSSSIWPNTHMRFHTIENILNDISVLLTQYGADCITFADELFVNSEKRMITICEELKKNGPANMKYRASARADILCKLGKKTLSIMKDTGFVSFAVGLESGSQRILDYIGKKITLKQIYEADQILTDYHFYKSYNFMTAMPTETIDDVKMTLKLIIDLARRSKYCPYPFSIMNKYIPLPNTELFDVAVNYGFHPPENLEDWGMMDTMMDNKESNEAVIRPWVGPALSKFIDRANTLISGLNNLYVGSSSNDHLIESAIKKLEMMV